MYIYIHIYIYIYIHTYTHICKDDFMVYMINLKYKGGDDTGVPISHIPDFLPPISHIPDFLTPISHIPDFLPPNIPYPRFHSQLTISQILQD